MKYFKTSKKLNFTIELYTDDKLGKLKMKETAKNCFFMAVNCGAI